MDLTLSQVTWTEHFVSQCRTRAPFLLRQKRKKFGNGWTVDLRQLESALYKAKEIDRPKTITRLIKYGDKSRYFAITTGKQKHRLVFVVEENKLITLYPYQSSWAACCQKKVKPCG